MPVRGSMTHGRAVYRVKWDTSSEIGCFEDGKEPRGLMQPRAGTCLDVSQAGFPARVGFCRDHAARRSWHVCGHVMTYKYAAS